MIVVNFYLYLHFLTIVFPNGLLSLTFVGKQKQTTIASS